jgi:hypothetical protein
VGSGSGKTGDNWDIVEFVRLKGNKYRQFPKKQSGVAGHVSVDEENDDIAIFGI